MWEGSKRDGVEKWTDGKKWENALRMKKRNWKDRVGWKWKVKLQAVRFSLDQVYGQTWRSDSISEQRNSGILASIWIEKVKTITLARGCSHCSASRGPAAVQSAGTSARVQFSDRDLAMEESACKLYERWITHHGVTWDGAEKMRRFHFLRTMRLVSEIHGRAILRTR
jgi:hypothetical protein